MERDGFVMAAKAQSFLYGRRAAVFNFKDFPLLSNTAGSQSGETISIKRLQAGVNWKVSELEAVLLRRWAFIIVIYIARGRLYAQNRKKYS